MTKDETSPPQDPDEQETESTVPATAAQKRIGSYKILETLGEGGMGIVYLAEQVTPIRRRVALKVIKLGMDTEQVLARFESERQALAILNHPNIAKVFDAGIAEQGRPYFVMEYVPGLPISLFCDQRRLNIRERLELFGQACDAIQHAHRNGIIHRDVKPSNVLVRVQDDKPVVKVIDFGLAKATSQRLTEKTLYTQHGVLIGTPEYMSPEQAGTTAIDVDSRTDIYSLGVVLYELLVGVLPFDPEMLRRSAGLEMLRIIREVEPPKPSTRISSLGEKARDVASQRHTEAEVLTKLVRGELEWITMRAIEKDPARRYPSAQNLASDIRRYLAGEPVLAQRASLAYRIRKLIGRRKGVASGLGAVATLLVIVLVAGITEHSRTEAAKDAALRWTLEQVIATGTDPRSIQPNWSELASRLRQENRASPTGELARLALRAAAQVEVSAPRFGLRSSLPPIGVVFKTSDPGRDDPIDPGIPYWYMAEVQGSWDGAPWKTISKGGVHWVDETGSGTAGDTVELTEFLNSDQLTSAPHQLGLRVQYEWIREGSASPPTTGTGVSVFPKTHTDEGAVLFSDTRSLDPLSINLFDQYPENFPTRVSETESTGPLSKYFRLDKMRLLRVLPPKEPPSGNLYFRRRGGSAMFGPGLDQPSTTGPQVVGVEMEGRLVRETPLPIAAFAVLRDLSTGKNVVEFPFSFGPGTIDLGGSGVRTSLSGGAISLLEASIHETRPTIPPPEADYTFHGQLVLTPSREIALDTRKFDHYLATIVSIPVEVEVFIVQGFASYEGAEGSLRGIE